MEMKVQTQSNGNGKNANATNAKTVAGSKEALSGTQQAGESKQGEKVATSFNDALRNATASETVQKELPGSSDLEVTENLLGGIPAELMALLFPQATESNPAKPLVDALLGQADAATNPDLGSEAWDKISEAIESPEGQAWLAQAINLLSAMGFIAPTVQSTDETVTVGVDDSTVGNVPLQVEQTATSKAQLQQVLAGLLKATQEEPDSLLTGQVIEGLTQLLTDPKVDEKGNGELRVRKQMATQGPTRSDLLAATTQGKDEVEVIINTEAPKSDKYAKALELLAYKSGYSVERLAILGQEEKISGNADVVTSTIPPQLGGPQELVKATNNVIVDTKSTVAVNIRDFTETMTDLVVKNMKSDALTGLSEARIILRPEHLGQVDVRISLQNGQLVAHFTAQQAFGKEALENQMAQLRTNLQSQGFQVERLEVTQSSSLQSGMFQDTRQQQPSRQSSGSNHDSDYHDGEEESFSTETIETDQLRRAASGATVDVSA
ncbi:MAG: flagellar hook-length control protein FliK [Gorillibacterium sp.]|nr:flagellar hook-length control protein FliK [Gorillibacterium sp.]